MTGFSIAVALFITAIAAGPIAVSRPPVTEELSFEEIIELVSVNSNSGQGNYHSGNPGDWFSRRGIATSRDGRFVAFISQASNLDPIDTDNKYDAFLRDRIACTTICVSKLIDDPDPDESYALEVDISDDGRYILFNRYQYSDPGIPNNRRTVELWVYDRIEEEIHWISRDMPYTLYGFYVNGFVRPSISADGGRIVLELYFAFGCKVIVDPVVYLIEPDYPNQSYSNYFLVSVKGNNPTMPAFGSFNPVISGNGLNVAFMSTPFSVWDDETVDPFNQVFLRDLYTGSTENVSITPSWEYGNEYSIEFDYIYDSLDISHTGRYVTFASKASDLIINDDNGHISDVFVRDRYMDITNRISEKNSGVGGEDVSYWPTISRTGRYIAFHSEADNLVRGDNDFADVFLHDQFADKTIRVTKSKWDDENRGNSILDAISANGKVIAFTTTSKKFVIPHDYSYMDVFVYEQIPLSPIIPNEIDPVPP